VLGPVHRRVGVPVWNRVVVPLRFLWNRITPGELGLELTTLLALALVGAFTYAFFASLLGNPSLLDVDRHALRVADDLRAGWLNSTAKLVTQLGSQAVLWPVLGLSALWLAATGRRVDALTLLVAFGLTILFVHIGKAAHDRPRPFGPLVSSSGSSFPSGHAAYAVAWVALAVVAVRDGPGWLQRVTLVAAAIVVAVAVALTRLYLRVHYLSDVLAGLGLGLLVFAACGMVALVVSFLRDNGRAA